MRKLLHNVWRFITAPFRWIGNSYRRLNRFINEEPEDTPLFDSLQKAVDQPSDLLVHLDALRKHLLRAALVLGLATILSFAFSKQIINLLAAPVGGMEGLIAIDPTEPIGTFMRVSLLSGFAIALPYIVLEMWLFAAPGLSKNSRIFGLAAIPVAALFFFGGLLFAWKVMLPTAIPFLVNFMGMQTELRPSSYIKFVTGVMFWIGIAFEFPLVIYVLARMGFISARVLANQWRLAVVILAVMSAAITPTVDPVNMAIVMGPMLILYFISIGLAYLAQRGRPQPAQAETG